MKTFLWCLKFCFRIPTPSLHRPQFFGRKGTALYFFTFPLTIRHSAVGPASRWKKSAFHPHEHSFCTTSPLFTRFFQTQVSPNEHWLKPRFRLLIFPTYRSVSTFKVTFLAFILNSPPTLYASFFKSDFLEILMFRPPMLKWRM